MIARGAVRDSRRCCAPEPPKWVAELVGGREIRWAPNAAQRDLRENHLSGERFDLVSLLIPDALSLGERQLEQACEAAYSELGRRLGELEAPHPVRIWNFIPGILQPLEEIEHRYMTFNAGRFHGLRGWFPRPTTFASFVPTATGVGHPGEDLVIHCLSAQQPGTAVENPRQVSSYRYSERYGRLPPCFSRATRLRAPFDRQLLVGGTASVCGENSRHTDDLRAQILETFANLAAVVRAAATEAPGELEESIEDSAEHSHLLSCYRSVRVYFVREQDLPTITSLVESRFRSAETIEYLQADLCRPDLLIEIEGLAELAHPATASVE
ncbi:MAG: hypothetical protein K0U98_00945 [Deltaproteobacteria bacterium]|nr:hypothetical protein [Deltaproteobacteria bacterium]